MHFAWVGKAKIPGRRKGDVNQIQKSLILFRFTKIWEKIIVIMGEEWTEGIVIGQERVEPRLA
jgi:hypothetical protein